MSDSTYIDLKSFLATLTEMLGPKLAGSVMSRSRTMTKFFFTASKILANLIIWIVFLIPMVLITLILIGLDLLQPERSYMFEIKWSHEKGMIQNSYVQASSDMGAISEFFSRFPEGEEINIEDVKRMYRLKKSSTIVEENSG